MNLKKHLFLILLILSVISCSRFSLLPKVYRIPIEQGNIISQEKIDNLKLGMTKRQVVYVLGTPLVADPFNTNFWAYHYSLQLENSKSNTKKQIALWFKDGQLEKIEGDLKPKELYKKKLTVPFADEEKQKKTIYLQPKEK